HLRRRLPEIHDFENNEWKLGLGKIIRPARDHAQCFKLEVEPWPGGIERGVDRNRLRPKKGSRIGDMPRQHAIQCITEANEPGTNQCRLRSGLYVELAIVGDDSKILLLTKEPTQGSHMAQLGMRLTCSIEEGAKLTDARDSLVDLRQIARRGL